MGKMNLMLRLCKAKVALCCETVQNTYTQCENDVEFLNIELGGKK